MIACVPVDDASERFVLPRAMGANLVDAILNVDLLQASYTTIMSAFCLHAFVMLSMMAMQSKNVGHKAIEGQSPAASARYSTDTRTSNYCPEFQPRHYPKETSYSPMPRTC